MSNKYLSTIGGASFVVLLLSLLGRGIGFIRESYFASQFGLSESYDIFLAGSVIPVIINTSFLYLIQNYLVPIFTEIRINKSNLFKHFTSKYTSLFILIALLFSILLYLFSENIISYYLGSVINYKNDFAVTIFNLMLITIPLSIGSAVLTAYLNSKFSFNIPLISQIILNIFIILSVVVFVEKIGILSIPLGFIIGNFFQLLFLIINARINLLRTNIFSGESKIFEGLSSGIIIVVLIETIGQLHIFIDRYFLSEIETGAISGINYATTVFMLPVSIISLSFSSVLFPKFSEYISNKSKEEFGSLLGKSLDVSLVLHIPIFFIFYFWGDFFIRLFFERGEFGSNDTFLTFNILKIFVFSIIFYSSFAITNKSLYSAGLLKQLLMIQIIGIIIKLFVNVFFVDKYNYNALVFGTTISYIAVGTLSVFFVRFYFKEFRIFNIIIKLFTYIIIALTVFYTIEIIFNSLNINYLIEKFTKILLFNVIFFLVLLLLKFNVILSLIQIIPKKFQKIIIDYYNGK